MKRKTSRTPRRRPAPRPVRPPVIPKPPAPTIAQERERRRRRRPPPPPPPSPAQQVEEAIQGVVSHEDWRLRQIEPGYSTHEAWRLQRAEARPGATPWSALMATVRGSVLGSTVRGLGESFGPVPEPVRGWLGAMHTPMYGRGGIPYLAPTEELTFGPSGMVDRKSGRVAAQLLAIVKGEERRAALRPSLTGGGGGYRPSYTVYRSPGGRGTTRQQGYSMGLVNWRIGL